MLKNKKIGFAITGSFCSMDEMLMVLQRLVNEACEVYVFATEQILRNNNRFNQADELVKKIEDVAGRKLIVTVEEAEIFGPKIPLDAVMVFPCTSNTLAKLAYGINDNAVTMVCKSSLRNNAKIILGVFTNDALSNSGENIMKMLNRKNYFLVPMYQDDIVGKQFSMLSNEHKAVDTLYLALENKQLMPMFEGEKK